MTPTITGGTQAENLEGMAACAPIQSVSLVDLTVVTEKTKANYSDMYFKDASENKVKGVLGYISDSMVSTDLNNDPHSSNSIKDRAFVKAGNLVRVMAWCDKQWGLYNPMLGTADAIAQHIKK